MPWPYVLSPPPPPLRHPCPSLWPAKSSLANQLDLWAGRTLLMGPDTFDQQYKELLVINNER